MILGMASDCEYRASTERGSRQQHGHVTSARVVDHKTRESWQTGSAECVMPTWHADAVPLLENWLPLF